MIAHKVTVPPRRNYLQAISASKVLSNCQVTHARSLSKWYTQRRAMLEF
jgi:hypothetical protein